MATVVQINANQPLRSFNLHTGDSLEELPPLEWRIKDVLPAAGLAAMYGPASSGKSFLALDMACAIADGGTWFGHNVKPSPVVYIALEGERGFPKRVKAWCKHNSRICPPDLYFILEQFRITSPLDIHGLAAICPPGCVIIIDTLNRACPLMEENSSRDMGSVLAACKTLMQLTQGLVLLIHHTGKNEAQGLRGHSSLLAALDASIEVSRSVDQRAWCIAKSKDDNDEVWHGFKLHVEQVGVDDDGDAITSCAIKPVGEVKTSAPANPVGKLQKLLHGPILALLAANGRTGHPGVPADTPSITYTSAIQCAAEQLVDVSSQYRASRAKGTLDSLIQRGILNSNGDFVWQN